jgi:hypothetical protein
MLKKTRHSGRQIDRRTFLKVAGATATGALALSSNSPFSPAGDAEAGVGIVAGVIVTAAVTDYVVRETDILGDDSPPEGLTADAAKEQSYRTARARKSTNRSTILDNSNLLNYMPETVFSEAKLAGVEAINSGKQKSEVQASAETEANSHYATIEANLLRTWNESVNEAASIASTLKSHPDVSVENVISKTSGEGLTDVTTNSKTITLRDGSSFTVQNLSITGSGGTIETNPVDGFVSNTWGHLSAGVEVDSGSEIVEYMDMQDGETTDGVYGFREIWSDIQSKFDQIDSDISLWVDEAYSSVQEGSIDTSDLLGGAELAKSFSDDVDAPRAVADLVALNIPTNIDNSVSVELADGTLLSGYLGFTSTADISQVSPDETINPSNISGDVIMSYDESTAQFNWTDWDSNKGVDGGLVWFTADPTTDGGQSLSGAVKYEITTTDEETATVSPSDFTETTDGSGNPVWEVDISGQLDSTISGIERIDALPTTTEQSYQSKTIQQQFTVLSTESGESISYSQNRDPQTDTNYISQEEWDAFKTQQEELIQKYEEEKNSGGGLFNIGIGGNIPGWAIVGGALAALFALNNN